jgi:gluconate:H+ symporter, GntP family
VHFFATILGLRVIISNIWVLSRNTRAIIGPLLPVLGISPVMAVMTICSGAMILMHVNDSFFWVVSGFTKMEVGTAYKTLTVTMAVMGVVVFAGVAILGPLLGLA